MRGPSLLVFLLWSAAGCRPSPRAGDAGILLDSGSAAPTRPALQLALEAQLPDAGVVRQPLDPAAAPFVPVSRVLAITANLPLQNYRLRILDELDRGLASDDVPEPTPDGLRYRVTLLAPLRPGHRYTVLLDAQRGATLDDGHGTPLAEQRFEFRTEGERQRDPPPKRTASKRRRHRAPAAP